MVLFSSSPDSNESSSNNFDTPARMIYAPSARQADLLYLTGLFTEDPFLWFEVNGRQTVMVSDLEFGRAQRVTSSNIQVLSYRQAREEWGMQDRQARLADYVAAASRHNSVTAWSVPPDFPLKLAYEIQGKKLELKTPDSPFCPERTRKTKTEIEQIKFAIRLAEHGFYHAEQIIKEAVPDSEKRLVWHGEILTSERLRGEINAEITRCGGSTNRTIAAPGRQGADPHESGHGPIRTEQPLIIDIFPRLENSGYYGDFTRTLVKGAADEKLNQAFAAVKNARQAVLETIKPGINAGELHRKAADTLAAHGFENKTGNGRPQGFFHGTGHGLGLELHEKPSLGPDSKDTLEIGNVITVEPGLYYPEWGGVRLEDVAVVTEQGCDNLTAAPTALAIC